MIQPSGNRSVLILSRGQRLERLNSSIARALSSDTRVGAMIEPRERPLWQGIPGVEARTLEEAAALEAPASGDIAAEVRRIEAETGLRVYQAARNYLLYGRLHSEIFGWRKRRWMWQDEREIVTTYVRAYHALRILFDRHDPAIVLLEAPDHIYAALAQAMAYKRGTLVLGLYFAPLAGDCSMFLYTGFQPQNVLMRYYWDSPEEIPEAAWQRARSMIEAVRSKGPPTIGYVGDMKERSKAVVAPMLRKAMSAVTSREQWRNFMPKALEQRAGLLHNELWLRKHLRHDIPDAPYVLYYMQHQPEASATTQAPHCIDQALLIEQVAVNAPAGWRIVVKEHPRTYPARGPRYFRALLDLPNVHLCHPTVSSHDLLDRAKVVLTLTGSVGIEALFAGKPVAVVGRPYYAFFPGVMRLDRPGDLFDALEGVGGREPEGSQLERFAAAYYASVFDAGTLAADRMWPEPEEGGRRIAQAVRRHLDLMANGGIRVSDFAPFQS